MDDGLLDLVVFEEQSRFRTVCSVPRLFNGTVERIRGCRIKRITEVTIEAADKAGLFITGLSA